MNQLGGKNNHLKNLFRYLNSPQTKVYIICCSKVEGELRDFMLHNGVDPAQLVFIPHFKKLLIVPFILEAADVFKKKNIQALFTLQMQSDIFGGVAARLAGIKRMYSVHESKIIEDNISWLKRIFYRVCNTFVKDWFLKTIVVSHGLKKEIIECKFRRPQRVEVIHLGIEVPREHKSNAYDFEGLRTGKPLIGTITRFSKEKGLDRFLNAIPAVIRHFPQSRFILVGKGDEEANLREMARRLGIQKSVTIQSIEDWSDELVYGNLKKIDIFVMPSLREGCPTSLLQALSFARPVVASAIDGINEIVEHGKDGILVDTSNAELFAENLVSLCRNWESAIRLGMQGQDRVESDFTVEAEVGKIRTLLSGGHFERP